MLDELLGLLDKPRQALWNVGEGLSEGDLGKAAPGLLGLLSGGLAATGVGLPLALGLGSAVGGLGQSLFGKEASTPDDLLGRMGMEEGTGRDLAGFALGAATDPLSYIGAGLGRRAGAGVGRSLDRTAEALGPRYGTTLEDFAGVANKKLDELAPMLRDNPRALGEIPKGSSFLDSGGEAVAFRTPSGDVLRLSDVAPGTRGRPVADSVLQPTRSVDYPAGDAMLRAERSPFVNVAGRMKTVDRSPDAQKLKALAASEGLDFHDVIPANWGRLGNQPLILDSGAVRGAPGFDNFVPVGQMGNSPSRGLLHRLLGSDSAMQHAVEQGLANPGYEQYYQRLGGLAGLLASKHQYEGQ